MTVTTPESGFRARLRRLTRGTVVFAIALSATGLGAGSAMAADGADADDESVDLVISAGTRGTVAPGSATSASVTVRNDTESAVSDGRVVVELGSAPLGDDAALGDWLDTGEIDGEFASLGSDTTEPVAAGSSTTTVIPVSQESLGELAPGVYPLRATLSDATADGADARSSRDVTSAGVLVVTETTTTQTVVIVPITATPEVEALLTADELSALTATDGALTAQLDGVAGTTAVVAVDPSIPAAIRVLGTDAPASAVEWLDRLESLPNERFALQFGDADAATQASAGLTTLLQPTTLANFLDPTRFASGPVATPEAPATPAPTPTTGPQLPDDETLQAIEGETTGILWPRGEVSAENIAAFAGFTGEGGATILPSTSLEGGSGAHAMVGGHEVLVAHAATSDALSRVASENSAAARQQALAEASAHLFLASQSSPSAPLLVGLARDDTRTAAALRDAVSAVDSFGFGLEALRALPAAEATVVSEPGTTRAASLKSLLADEPALGAFSTILADPQVLLSPERIELLRAITVGSSDTEFSAAVTAEKAETGEILAAVSIPESSTIQLLTANADLPFQVRNDLPWPVTIDLHVSPSEPRLDVEPVTTATVQGNTNSRIKVPVSARVGSGELDLRLELFSPTGVRIGQTETVRVAVRAEWETIGLVVFGSLIVILIALGVLRTVWRKRQDAQPQVNADTDADAGSETGADAAAEGANG
ncbi:DUF6049 family protein [Microbacterium sp. SD291]|uniref:DUF6049 family protein n=1 Tax=Microbacterium sp. SD291 TaxID=2782007 RepID=UPI001A97B127|nr:DUF6049 family protein [Microbacterium sp. SD291]MBO0980288.1 hypothetical protein [Microbacterium sp. SD291]